MIMKKTDIANITNALDDLEKLKLIIFDEDQYHIFNNIQKPFLLNKKILRQENILDFFKKNYVTRNNVLIKENSFYKKVNKNEDQDYQIFLKALDNLRAKKKLNTIDERLLKIVGVI